MKVRFQLDFYLHIPAEDEAEVRSVYPTVTEEKFKSHFEHLLSDDLVTATVNSVQTMIIEEAENE